MKLKGMVPDNEIVFCEDCDREIWKFWHIPIKEKDVEMTKCGPCYFENETTHNS